MKKALFYILIISFQLNCLTIFSQNDASYFSDSKTNSLETTSLILNSTNSNNQLVNVNQISTSNTNSVVLRQVGMYNVSDINQSKQTQQNVSQLGNSNYYSFIDYYNNSPVNLSILQNGNANSLQIYGSNSLINGMKIVQKSNFKNIVIKNYK